MTIRSCLRIGSAVALIAMSAGCSRQDEEIAKLRRELEELKAKAKQQELAKEVEALKSTKVQGSVFIVTRGGTNYKLGLVNIGFVDEAPFLARLQSIKEQKEQKFEAALNEHKRATETFLAALKPYKERINEYRAAAEKLKRNESLLTRGGVLISGDRILVGSRQDKRVADDYIKAQHELAKIGAVVKPLYDAVRERQEKMANADLDMLDAMFVAADSLIESVPSRTLAKTDGDGRFSFSLKRPMRGYLVARARRSVGDKDEQYAWITQVETSATDDEISLILSNDNLVESKKILERERPRESYENVEFMDIVTRPIEFTVY